MAPARGASQMRRGRTFAVLPRSAVFLCGAALLRHWAFVGPLHSYGSRSAVRGGRAQLFAGGDAATDSVLETVRTEAAKLMGEGVWEAGAEAIAAHCDGDLEHAENVLAKAYGWRVWVQMNKPVYLKPKVIPAADSLRKALAWVRQGPLAMSAEELKTALLTAPLPYLTDPETSYREALQAAPEQFQDPQVFRELLQRAPKVLQLTWNCEKTDPNERGLDAWGERIHCDGQCTNCWRTATPMLEGRPLDGVEV
eukprot:TRINITY_DN27966_c0_g1_i1.p1 TRINITY_DN27966_c0_g1~~TRINITY_DN27966_c0_g1_i1.p1  ORF type:complete len:277 (+),score=47.53 TRINITY_DN27966_c0_g1_i1:75-833(+)